MAKRRPKPKSEYGTQLLEKQKIRGEYNLRERQFRKYFEQGKNPEEVYQLLERRLDNVVYRMGLAVTRPQARQVVNHGHIQVNGRTLDIPSYKVRVGDVVSMHPSSVSIKLFEDLPSRLKKYEAPSWIALDKKTNTAKITGLPDSGEQVLPFSIQTVIEFYSR